VASLSSAFFEPPNNAPERRKTEATGEPGAQEERKHSRRRIFRYPNLDKRNKLVKVGSRRFVFRRVLFCGCQSLDFISLFRHHPAPDQESPLPTLTFTKQAFAHD
jgi:hypothetical protein